jgi:hypothetical protein
MSGAVLSVLEGHGNAPDLPDPGEAPSKSRSSLRAVHLTKGGPPSCGFGPLDLGGTLFLELGRLLAFLPYLPVGRIYRFQQVAKERRVVDCPQSVKGRAQQPHVVLGEQADGYDAIAGHRETSSAASPT